MQRDCLILFRSLTYAQRGRRALERAGITAVLRRAPADLTDRGCAYGLKLRADRLQGALGALEKVDVRHGRVFLREADGSYREVQE